MRSGLAAAAAGLVLTAFLAPAARAADAPASPHFNIMGPSGCANWPKSGAITSASKAVSLNWALGYLSGSAAQDNLALLDQFDPDSVDAWLTTYCGAHPADPLPLAVRELERDLKAKLPPPPSSAPPPPMFVPPAVAAPAPAPAPAAKAKPTHRTPSRRKPAATAKPSA